MKDNITLLPASGPQSGLQTFLRFPFLPLIVPPQVMKIFKKINQMDCKRLPSAVGSVRKRQLSVKPNDQNNGRMGPYSYHDPVWIRVPPGDGGNPSSCRCGLFS